jgi:PiT family inorganic phosphate transporter
MAGVNLVVVIVAVALLFDYFNGFNDAANSIATVVATRVLTPLQAVAWAAFFNFVSAFTFGTGVAKTIGSGMVDLSYVTPLVILGGLVGAISWVLAMSVMGLPVSASHALVGGYAGSAMSNVAALHGLGRSLDAVILAGWIKPVLFIVVSPVLGLVLSGTFMTAVYWLFRRATPKRMDGYFRKLQLLSAAAFSYAHGTNDAQKTMGIITGALVAGGYLTTFEVPVWVIFSAHGAIALGTLMGGWRVVETMGTRITRLRPREGFCAETAGATSVFFATLLGQPVSTTHTIAGAIAGVGAVRRVKSVRWRMAQRIVWAWVFTIPCAAGVGWLAYRALAALAAAL